MHRTPVWYFLQRIGSPDENGCRRWLGAHNNRGYGIFASHRLGGNILAHRFAYDLFVEPIPDGLIVLHRCDIRDCTEPAHLRLGTHAENTWDAVDKGRLARGERSGTSKLTEGQVREIRSLYGPYPRTHTKSHPITVKALAEMFGVGPHAIQAILRRETWRHIL